MGPRFVFDLCRSLSTCLDILVLAPHARGAAEMERMQRLDVRRFRYAPARWETLAYGGGILAGFRRNPSRIMLVPFFLAASVWSVARVLRKERFDVIHAHWLLPQGLVAICARWLANKRIPILCTSHGGDLFALRSPAPTALKAFVLSHCEAITVVSNAMLKAVAELDPGSLARVRIAPMGADLQGTFTPCRHTERAALQLLFVGRLAEKKGLHVLIDALPQIVRDFPGVRLRVAGDGPESEQLHARGTMRAISQSIDWLGPRSHAELVAEYRGATMLVFPSIETADGDQEGLGLVPIEALGCECPVVASDLPAVRDVIVDGETGVLVPPGDPDRLAMEIACLLSDRTRRAMLARQGREMVVTRFDWQMVAHRYRILLESLVNGGVA
jgi:glycosyltransferase involved in cell wall biosynthesis